MKKYIAIIEYAPNCYRCDHTEFFTLKFFNTLEEMFTYILAETNNGFFIKELWDAEANKRIENISVKYFHSHHHIDHIIVLENHPGEQVKLFECFRDPYNHLVWKICGKPEE
ncbi:MAG: hypothetical protein WC511_02115 [Candidatus Pacearchaeota archaeon]